MALARSRAVDGSVRIGQSLVLVLRMFPESMNERDKRNLGERYRHTSEVKQTLHQMALGRLGLRFEKARVWMAFWWPDRRYRDRGNYAHWKSLFDGLVECGILATDRSTHLDVPSVDMECDPVAPRSVIVIEPWGDERDGRRPSDLLAALSPADALERHRRGVAARA